MEFDQKAAGFTLSNGSENNWLSSSQTSQSISLAFFKGF